MEQDKHIHIRANQDFAAKLAEIRKAENDLPSASEMLRRLVDRAHKQLQERD